MFSSVAARDMRIEISPLLAIKSFFIFIFLYILDVNYAAKIIIPALKGYYFLIISAMKVYNPQLACITSI